MLLPSVMNRVLRFRESPVSPSITEERSKHSRMFSRQENGCPTIPLPMLPSPTSQHSRSLRMRSRKSGETAMTVDISKRLIRWWLPNIILIMDWTSEYALFALVKTQRLIDNASESGRGTTDRPPKARAKKETLYGAVRTCQHQSKASR